MPRKQITDLIAELRSWLPNYDHGPESYPTVLFRILASLQGGEELEDMGYEPLGKGSAIGWHEADQLGRVLTTIEGKRDVEELVRGLLEEEGEGMEERRRPAGRRARENTEADRDPSVYLSYSEGRYRVIQQGVPISPDKNTAAEALAAAKQFKIKVSDRAWDGDAGEWVALSSILTGVRDALHRRGHVNENTEVPNIFWRDIPPGSPVELVGHSYFVTLPSGKRASVYWGGNDAADAQRSLEQRIKYQRSLDPRTGLPRMSETNDLSYADWYRRTQDEYKKAYGGTWQVGIDAHSLFNQGLTPARAAKAIHATAAPRKRKRVRRAGRRH